LEIRFRSCPLPSTVRAERNIGVRVEVVLHESTMSAGVIPIFNVTMPEMVKPPCNVADVLAYCLMIGGSPLKIVFSLRGIELSCFNYLVPLFLPKNGASGDL
jgi:hypothetical protein